MDARTLCLGGLQLGDASGYKIRKFFEKGVLSHVYGTSFGSIYPALSRLVEDGHAVCREATLEKRRNKKIYSITPKGRAALSAALQVPPEADKRRSDSMFILMFGHLIPRPHLQRLVDERIKSYRETLARMEGSDDGDRPPSARLFRGLGCAMFSAAADHLERNRHLLDESAAPAEGPEPIAAAAE